MSIQCQICKMVFSKQITNSHLKIHNMTTIQYKEQYGLKSLSSEQYRLEKSKANSGENNPHFNKKHSVRTRKEISKKKKGTPAHNKGIKLPDDKKENLLKGIARREQTYRESGYHPRNGFVIPDKTKKKISIGVSKYAKNNPEEMVHRARKAIETKSQPGGYFDTLREQTIISRERWLGYWNFELLNYTDEYLEIKCTMCGTITRRVAWYQCHDKMCNMCHPRSSVSKEEVEIYNWIRENVDNDDIVLGDKTVFGTGFEIDILLPSKNIGIEYNGLWWHSELQGKGKRYHRTKYEKAKEKGIFLIQIFEDEWIYKKNICKSRILQKLGFSKERFYARKCDVVMLDKKEALSFLEENHLQGKGYGSHFFGLIYADELVAVMSFSRLTQAKGYKDSKKDVYELNRYASKGTVIGGASRLFKEFTKTVRPIEIVSYADLRWNIGDLYGKLGFEFVGNTEPGYWYENGDKRYHRYALRKNKDDDSNLTEWENRQLQGWNRIWDCGHAKWVWKRD